MPIFGDPVNWTHVHGVRSCNCVGYLTNPGGRCCMDLQAPTWTIAESNIRTFTVGHPPVDEERVRKIVREEIADLPIAFDVPDVPPKESE